MDDLRQANDTHAMSISDFIVTVFTPHSLTDRTNTHLIPIKLFGA